MLPNKLFPGRVQDYARNIHDNKYYQTPPTPATRTEIYGLALGTCFLFIIMSWLLVVGIRTAIATFGWTPNKNRNTDPEGDAVIKPQSSQHIRPFLPTMGQVIKDELMLPAGRRSIKIASGLTKDICSFRRNSHPPPMDEEAAMGGHTERVGTKIDDSFLHQRYRKTDAQSV